MSTIPDKETLDFHNQVEAGEYPKLKKRGAPYMGTEGMTIRQQVEVDLAEHSAEKMVDKLADPRAEATREQADAHDEVLRNLTPKWTDTPTETGHYAIRYKGFTDPHNVLVRVSMHTDGFSVFSGRMEVPDQDRYEFYRIEI